MTSACVPYEVRTWFSVTSVAPQHMAQCCTLSEHSRNGGMSHGAPAAPHLPPHQAQLLPVTLVICDPRSLLRVGLCGGKWAVCPPDPKIKARLKTPVNSPAGARDNLRDTHCHDLLTQEASPPEPSPPTGGVPTRIRCPERVRVQTKVTQQGYHRATPRIQGASSGLGFSPHYNTCDYF